MPELASAAFTRKGMELFRFLRRFFSQSNGAFSLFALVFLANQWSFFAFCASFQNLSTKFSLFFENIKKAHKVSKSCVLLFVFSTKSDKFLHFLLCLHNQVANISFQNRMIASYLSIPVNQVARPFLHSLNPAYKSRKLAHISDNIVGACFVKHFAKLVTDTYLL